MGGAGSVPLSSHAGTEYRSVTGASARGLSGGGGEMADRFGLVRGFTNVGGFTNAAARSLLLVEWYDERVVK